MQDIFGQIRALLDLGYNVEQFQSNLIRTVLIICVLWLVRFVIHKVIDYETKRPGTRFWWKKMVNYLAFLSGAILIGRLWITGAESLVTFLGLVSAGLAIALAGPVTDLAAWAFVISRRPFAVGDRIEIGPHAGDVVDIRLLQFSVLEIGNWVDGDQSTGRVIHIPNRKVFSEVLANFNGGFEYIWNEISVRLTFESDWQKAKAILQEIADRHFGNLGPVVAKQVERASRRYPIMYSKFTPIVYTRGEVDSIQLTVRYLCQIRQRRSTAQTIWEDILTAFAREPNINFAYPTQRFYSGWLEGQQTIGATTHPAGPIKAEELRQQAEDRVESNNKRHESQS